jgi:ribosomal protein L35AE/L33A
MVAQRQSLGEKVTEWIAGMRRQHPGFTIVDIVVRQSSDDAFHCVSHVVTYRLKTKKTRG